MNDNDPFPPTAQLLARLQESNDLLLIPRVMRAMERDLRRGDVPREEASLLAATIMEEVTLQLERASLATLLDQAAHEPMAERIAAFFMALVSLLTADRIEQGHAARLIRELNGRLRRDHPEVMDLATLTMADTFEWLGIDLGDVLGDDADELHL
jgi:hypothetical protein